MAFSVEVTSRVGVSKDNPDYSSFRKWLTPIKARATIHPDESRPPIQIGEALGFIISRSAIRLEFRDIMEAPHKGTMDLALDLFDRYGRLKEEIREHALRKGSGVWGKELDEGNLVLIEDILVERKHRRKRVGSKLVLHILEEAMKPRNRRADKRTTLPHHEDSDPRREDEEMLDSDSDEELVECHEDFTQTRHKKSEWDERWCAKTLLDKEALIFLKSHTRDGVLEEFPLGSKDGRGDTVLHVAAKASKPRCVAWLLRQPTEAKLAETRNYAGYTPLEALQAQLETRRIQVPFGHGRVRLVADKFDGFDEDSVTSLLLLQGEMTPSPEQLMRAKFGCSCSQCLGGFLSPRMLKKLSDQAHMQHAFLTNLRQPGENGWYTEFKDLLAYFPESFRSQVRHSKALQTAFVLLMSAVAGCLSGRKIPCKASVVEYLQGTEPWERVQSQYFSKGGTVACVANAVFGNAEHLDLEVGDTIEDTEPEEYYKGLPTCRNDFEFEFVRRHCADDAPPEKDPLPVPMPWLMDMFRLDLEGKDVFEHMGM
ncbi:unnamed protein product [Parascedosporium putredinis]|uniref:Uncharacterized protein n=1 Tax=Parascedosporium putredinis TaxID=1442378 RepID=A0A9P1H1V8_9PEZI|nr:unnamed protein product [Parascedosporium putredinis]CAI7993109.1 unnamed protein product [Parascedosporium putredinis]